MNIVITGGTSGIGAAVVHELTNKGLQVSFQDMAWPVRFLVRMLGQSAEQASAYLTRLVYKQHEGVHWQKTKPMLLELPATSNDLALELWNYSHSILATNQ